MFKLFITIAILYCFISLQATAQLPDVLRQKIQQIVSSKNTVVGVSVMGSKGKDTLSINGNWRFPMQSVFKFHIALAMLSEIDKGKFSLNQEIKIEKKELSPLYSPIREDHPEGGAFTIAEILQYTVSKSDNTGCDVLLRMLGGPHVVEEYFLKNNFTDIAIKFNEAEQQSKWELQFQNWTTPNATNRVLAFYYYNSEKLLSGESHDFIWKTMKETETGANRLKGGLPKDAIVSHKTGTSGTNKQGITAAVNDIGVVLLPDGEYYFISVFVSNSKENDAANEKLIADISKAVWDYYAETK